MRLQAGSSAPEVTEDEEHDQDDDHDRQDAFHGDATFRAWFASEAARLRDTLDRRPVWGPDLSGS